jgi:phenylpyruvate tautomerase PptA (4-oxalocrotonate tautomerase family)
MDKDELINKLAELMHEMTEVKRADVAVILSYIITAVHEDMAEQFAFHCTAISPIV